MAQLIVVKYELFVDTNMKMRYCTCIENTGYEQFGLVFPSTCFLNTSLGNRGERNLLADIYVYFLIRQSNKDLF